MRITALLYLKCTRAFRKIQIETDQNQSFSIPAGTILEEKIFDDESRVYRYENRSGIVALYDEYIIENIVFLKETEEDKYQSIDIDTNEIRTLFADVL